MRWRDDEMIRSMVGNKLKGSEGEGERKNISLELNSSIDDKRFIFKIRFWL